MKQAAMTLVLLAVGALATPARGGENPGVLRAPLGKLPDGTKVERYPRSEQAFVVLLMEMVLQGVSTRKVSAVTAELCGASFSKSTVSALCARLDPIREAWRHPPRTGRYPFLLVEGFGVRVCEEEQVRPRSTRHH